MVISKETIILYKKFILTKLGELKSYDFEFDKDEYSMKIYYKSSNNSKKYDKKYRINITIKDNKKLYISITDDEYSEHSSVFNFKILIFDDIKRPLFNKLDKRIYDNIISEYKKYYSMAINQRSLDGMPGVYLREAKLNKLMNNGKG